MKWLWVVTNFVKGKIFADSEATCQVRYLISVPCSLHSVGIFAVTDERDLGQLS